MNIELVKRMLDACYLAKRAREMLPPLPNGVMPSYIQYIDVINKLERQGKKARVSDISDALDLPRPGVTRSIKEMELKGYLQKTSSPEDGLSDRHRGRCPTLAEIRRGVLPRPGPGPAKYPRSGHRSGCPHHRSILQGNV